MTLHKAYKHYNTSNFSFNHYTTINSKSNPELMYHIEIYLIKEFQPI